MNGNRLLLIFDGSWYLHRAHYMAPKLTDAEGNPTGTIKLCTSMIAGAVKQFSPSHTLVVFDHHGPSFRNRLYAGYKTKNELDPDLALQFPLIVKLLRAMGYTVLIIKGVEGDDVIGSAAVQFKIKTLIATGDKDMAQLLTSKRVALANTRDSKEVLTAKGVVKKYGVQPNQIQEWLMLMGDTNDGIPGVPGVGKKRASELLAKYKTVKNLLTSVKDLTPALKRNLIAHKPMFALTRRLVAIKTDVNLGVTLNDLVPKPNRKEEDRIREQLSFRNLRKGAIL